MPLCTVALILALIAIALGACGGDDDDGDGEDSLAGLESSLPTADDIGFDERIATDWDDATDLLTGNLVIGAATEPSELGASIDDAGFQSAVGKDFGSNALNLRVRAMQFDSEEGALEARDLLHEQDLKSPCAEACIVTPLDYELDDVPDSTAVHHVPVRRDLPAGQVRVEAHHAEFPIGSRLYVVQMDGRPSPTFSADFDKLMGTVYESASSAEQAG